jgi:type IV pilus assembly protein PilB
MNTRKYRRNILADTIKQIQLAIKSTATYPGDHPASSQATTNSYETLINHLNKNAPLTVSVSGDKLLVNEVPIDEKITAISNLARDLDQRSIASITFFRGLTLTDFRVFLDAMIKSPSILSQEGGVASVLKQKCVSTIKLNEIKYGKINEELPKLGDTQIIHYLRGENDSLGEFRPQFLHILEDDPQRISELIIKTVEAHDTGARSHTHLEEARVAVESINRIAADLLTSQKANWIQFKDKMTSILSSLNDVMLEQMTCTMEIKEEVNGDRLSALVTELFYTNLADICINEYKQHGEIDMTFIENAAPGIEERKNVFSLMKKKLGGFASPDEERQVYERLCKEREIKEQKTSVQHGDPSIAEERKKLRDDLNRLLSEGKNDEIKTIIRDASKRLDDTSWKIRKKVAEHLQDITDTLDEFDKLKENFRDLSEILVKRIKQETHVDTYLIVSDNLYRVCNSHNGITRYFINDAIGSRLFKASKLSRSQLQKTLIARKNNGKSIQYNLGLHNFVDEGVLTQFLAQPYKGCRITTLSSIHDIPEQVLKAIPAKFIKRHLILPFKLDSGNLHTAMMEPNDLHVLNDIRFLSGYSVIPYLAAEYYLLNAIQKFYHIKTITEDNNQIAGIIEGEDDFREKEDAITPMEELKESDAPVVRFVNTILKQAITQNASDIHIEPYENELRVRLRIDGTLTTLFTPSIRYTSVIPSRIKVMAGLDISEKRLPQDGRFKVRIDGSYVDFRVSTFPGICGEMVVLRLLDKSNLTLDMNNLGMDGNDLNTVLTSIYKSKGMILVTGPTGSGKTTTLYSMLQCMNDGSRNISTAEDPIEYNLRGINQFQMKPKIGLNFARALRTFLRQDPDIIMVGEIRDLETAEIAIKAALTGHLVLSTLHTNSALETITRLRDIGIEPYLISSSLSLIIAQRLMRKVCDQCKAEASPTDLQKRVLENHAFNISGRQFFKGEGCDECNNTGYRGRVAIYEVMPMWEKLQELILKGTSSIEMAKSAQGLGLITLKEQGFQKTMEGITDLDEWMRVVA